MRTRCAASASVRSPELPHPHSLPAVLVTWACTNLTDVDMIGRETQRPGSTPGNLIDPWVKRQGATKCPTPGFKLSSGHAPLSAADWRDTGEGGTVVAMFRRPSDRLRSAHRRKGQPFGCRGQPASCAIHYLSEQRGCQLRMLVSFHRATPPGVRPTKVSAPPSTDSSEPIDVYAAAHRSLGSLTGPRTLTLHTSVLARTGSAAWRRWRTARSGPRSSVGRPRLSPRPRGG